MSEPATEPRVDAPRLPPGTQLHRYRIQKEIGAGGMARVYAADDEELGRTVALKLIRRSSTDGIASRHQAKRLLREAQAMAQLSHPNIVPLYDVQIFGHQVVIAMEYVKGGTLRAWQSQPDRPLREIVDAYVQAGRGLAAAHQAGLVHRDFKPDNVLVSEAGEFKVTDFGLARALTDPTGGWEATQAEGTDVGLADPLTVTGALLGTPLYMAPEQHDGGGASIDARADQFAFCVALLEALQGEQPYVGSTTQRLRQAKLQGPRSLSSAGVPGWLRGILQRGLQPDPEDRFDTLDALLEQLSAPRRRAGPWLVGAAVVGVSGLIVAESTRESALACDPGTERIETAWGPSQRDRIRGALASTSAPYAQETGRRVEAHLDRYAQQWAEAYDQACRAAASESVRAQRACLERRREELAQLVGLLSDASRAGLDRVGPSLERLPAIAECTGPVTVGDQGLSATERERIERVWTALGQARAHEMTAGFEAGLEYADAAVAEARDLGQPELLVRALGQRGVLLEEQGRNEDAHEAYVEAALIGEANDLPLLAARNARRAMYVLVYRLDRYDASEQWQRHARSQLDRIAQDPRGAVIRERAELSFVRAIRAGRQRRYDEALGHIADALRIVDEVGDAEDLRVRLFRLRGALRAEAGDVAEGRQDLERALSLAQDLYGEGHPRTADVMTVLAGVLSTFGDFAGAIGQLEVARSILEGSQGPEHPRVLGLLYNHGTVLIAAGQGTQARPLLERAAAGYLRLYGDDHEETARTRYMLASALMQANELDEAQTVIDRSIRAYELHPEVSPLSHGRALLTRGQIHQQRMDWARAKVDFDRGREIIEKGLGPNHPSVTDAMFVQGELAIQMEQYAYAVDVLETCLQLRTPMVSPIYLSLTEFELAKALWGDRQPDRAFELAERAVERLRSIPAGKANATHMDETITAWKRGESSPYGPQDPRRR